MATPSFKLHLHVLGSKIHKWLAIFVGVQVLSWIGTGTLNSFLDIEAVRFEHIVSRASERCPPMLGSRPGPTEAALLFQGRSARSAARQ